MAFKSVKITYTPNYLVIQGNKDLVQATRRGLLIQNILDEPWRQTEIPDHVHSVIPRMSLSGSRIDNLSANEASSMLIHLLRAHSDVVSGRFLESDMPSRLYQQNSEHGDLMWQIFPWQYTIIEDILRNPAGAKIVLKKLMTDIYEPDIAEDARAIIAMKQNRDNCKVDQVKVQ